MLRPYGAYDLFDAASLEAEDATRAQAYDAVASTAASREQLIASAELYAQSRLYSTSIGALSMVEQYFQIGRTAPAVKAGDAEPPSAIVPSKGARDWNEGALLQFRLSASR